MCGRRLQVVIPQPQSANDEYNNDLSGLCSACGFMNITGELFCEQCGVQLPPVSSQPPPLPTKVFD